MFSPERVVPKCTAMNWSLMRGICLWSIWFDRNSIIFEGKKQAIQKIRQVVWEILLDNARVPTRITMTALKNCEYELQLRGTPIGFDMTPHYLAPDGLGADLIMMIKN